MAGPLSRSFATNTYFLRTVLNADPSLYDANALPFAFNVAAYDAAKEKDKLVFGFMRHDWNVQPVKPVQRGIDMVFERLKAEGHEGASLALLSPFCGCRSAELRAVVEFDGQAYKGARVLLDQFFRAVRPSPSSLSRFLANSLLLGRRRGHPPRALPH